VAPLASSLALYVGGSLNVPLVRDRFEYDDAGTQTQIFQRPAVGGTGELGLAVTLQ
jgi:hypothetical protein